MAEDRSGGLFPEPVEAPEGFVYREGFVSIDEERELIGEIQKLDLTPFQYYQFSGKRRTASFGWAYEFGKKDISPAPPIPAFLAPVRERAGTLFGIDPGRLAHASLIEYPVGAPIGWHRDIPHFGVVIGVSLNAACRMRFRKSQRSQAKAKRSDILSIELAARSIYLLSGQARHTWQHSIPPVKQSRYAIMLRTLRQSRNA